MIAYTQEPTDARTHAQSDNSFDLFIFIQMKTLYTSNRTVILGLMPHTVKLKSCKTHGNKLSPEGMLINYSGEHVDQSATYSCYAKAHFACMASL